MRNMHTRTSHDYGQFGNCMRYVFMERSSSAYCMINNRDFKNREAIPITPCQRITGTL
jgi:hypothetical protein